MLEKISWFIMNGVFSSYVTFIFTKFGILPSISDSWYEYEKHNIKKWNVLFTFFCWGFAMPAVILGLTLSEGSDFQFLIFLAASGIMFVGAAPDFKCEKSLDRIVHMVGAYTGVIGITVFQYVVFPQYWAYTTIFVCLSLLLFIYKQKFQEILWIEILSFLTYSYITYDIIF